MKIFVSVVSAAFLLIATAGYGNAEPSGSQVFYRFGKAYLDNNRGGEVFTDTAGAAGRNDDDSGDVIGAGIDLAMAKLGNGTLLGEVMVEYAKFSEKRVQTTTSTLLGAPASEKVVVSYLNVVIAPKYRWELGKFRPWIIPIGLAMGVNSPPSNEVTYHDYGIHLGAGAEYMVHDMLSLGVDYRINKLQENPNTDGSYKTLAVYAGINF